MRQSKTENYCSIFILILPFLLVGIVIFHPLENNVRKFSLGKLDIVFHSNALSTCKFGGDLHASGSAYNKSSPNLSSVGIGGRYRKLEAIEVDLARARAAIKEAARNGSMVSTIETQIMSLKALFTGMPMPFIGEKLDTCRSYLEMEKAFKIYVYKEGEPPLFHNGQCNSLYFSEGRFIHEMEKGMKDYGTTDPEKAHAYFLPFSVVMMVQYLHVQGSHDIHPIGRTIADYVDTISRKYGFWNRSSGADHFMVSCHDWGPWATTYVPRLYNNSIRVLCNANTSEGFNPSREVSFPEINLLTSEVTATQLGGSTPSARYILAFFAGRLHGHIRYLLFQHWRNKNDQDIKVYDQLPQGVSYDSMLKRSKFCLCPSGYEVASPRVVEAIYSECVPVLISQGYVPPFSDVLNWKAFSVPVDVKDIPNIKSTLMGISPRQYLRMHRRVKQVRRHFMVNPTPQRFDVFHMILHSIWLRRLNVHIK